VSPDRTAFYQLDTKPRERAGSWRLPTSEKWMNGRRNFGVSSVLVMRWSGRITSGDYLIFSFLWTSRGAERSGMPRRVPFADAAFGGERESCVAAVRRMSEPSQRRFAILSLDDFSFLSSGAFFVFACVGDISTCGFWRFVRLCPLGQRILFWLGFWAFSVLRGHWGRASIGLEQML